MIQINNLSKQFANNELFNNLSFKLNQGNRIGLVGRNGSGKSTLFKIILGEESYDSGEIIIPKGYKIGALKQHLVFTKEDIVQEVAQALSKENQYDIYRVEKILFGLGFTNSDLSKNPLSFSGGYQIRLNLAKLLIATPNLLLLDEPTNYLDLPSMRWLKNFLNSFEGEVILITHDREFMDSVTTHTMGIVRKNLFVIPGDTKKFYTQLASNEELHEKEIQSQEKKRKELEDFIAKNRVRASTAALAQSKIKELQKMQPLEYLSRDSNLAFDFNYKETPAKIILEAKDITFGYETQELLFEDISFSLKKGETLAIIGRNGKGKSTLLNILAGELKPISGSITSHPSVDFGHFGQTNIDRLESKNSIIDEIYRANPKLSYAKVRAICGAMMFSSDDADKQVSILSGGEKSRVMLGQILGRELNLLFLDEPTNHLDMESIESLIRAIKSFDGAVIIVTHSEELLHRVADRVIVFTKNGAEVFDDNYEMFLEKMGWDEEEQTAKSAPKKDRQESRKLRANLIQEKSKKITPIKKTIEKLESNIIKLEDELKIEHKELIDASNNLDSAKVIDLSKVVATKEQLIEESFLELETMHDELDSLTLDYDTKLEELL